jgi:hypothetical protein
MTEELSISSVAAFDQEMQSPQLPADFNEAGERGWRRCRERWGTVARGDGAQWKGVSGRGFCSSDKGNDAQRSPNLIRTRSKIQSRD